MSWLTLIIQLFSLAGKLFDLWHEKDAEKSTQKKEALNVALEGLDKRDPSAITRGIDAFNRVR